MDILYFSMDLVPSYIVDSKTNIKIEYACYFLGPNNNIYSAIWEACRVTQGEYS